MRHVGNLQVPKIENGDWIPAVDYDAFFITDQVPVYRDLQGDYSWGTKNDGNVHIATGGLLLRYHV